MAIFGALNALGVQNGQWKQGFSEARGEVDKTRNTTRSFFKELNDTYGKRSLLGQGLKIAAGGGGSHRWSFTTLKEFDEVTGKIADLSDAYRKGKDGQYFIGDLARSIPVLGTLTKGFDNLRLAITGERVEMQREEEYVKAAGMQAGRIVAKQVLERAKQTTMEWAEILSQVE